MCEAYCACSNVKYKCSVWVRVCVYVCVCVCANGI